MQCGNVTVKQIEQTRIVLDIRRINRCVGVRVGRVGLRILQGASSPQSTNGRMPRLTILPIYRVTAGEVNRGRLHASIANCQLQPLCDGGRLESLELRRGWARFH